MDLRRNRILRLAALFGLTFVLAGSSHRSGLLSHEAYVWQRLWTPAVAEAVRNSSDLVGTWRVLAAQTDGAGRLRTIPVDWAVLRETGRPVVAVLRIEGQLQRFNGAELLSQVRTLLADIATAGAPVSGIEVDHDCGTARLPAYADFLGRVRAEIGGRPLSITALPTWIGSPALERIVAAVDEVVLQVHAVEAPGRGLFNPVQAERWARHFAQRSAKPFRLALPTYGVRVSFTAAGAIAAIASEAPVLDADGDSLELMARPQEVAALMRALEGNTPPQLKGFTWFRLPTASDRRAWTASTWRAVVQRQPLDGAVTVEIRTTGDPGLSDVVLVNAGSVDLGLPRSVELPSGDCHVEGVNGYVLSTPRTGPALDASEVGMLRAGRERIVGWMRCDTAGE